ncbi:putative Por_Secre_tail domain-containing protein [Tenacibaculum sp. 190524A02b]|uniref:Por_Secre_tail domain-containing protein n=1 Tax=Tenacibaculum vairaonense TaxID=3137860 RepID=A0ABP1F5F0_9FLAO
MKLILFLGIPFFLLWSPIRGQCTIPNRNFNSFYKKEITDIAGSTFSIDLPTDWTESFLFNLVPRRFHGIGFFDKYEGTDAVENVALTLKRGDRLKSTVLSANKGFTRFKCNSIPKKLTGFYKFKGTDIVGKPDTLKIVVKFSTKADTLTKSELNGKLNFIRNSKSITITKSTESFMPFEIDFSDFSELPIEYISIHLIMLTGYASPPDNFATAVIDNLKLVYESLGTSVPKVSKKDLVVYPNPTENKVHIKSKNQKKWTYEVYNIYGKMVLKGLHTSTISLGNLSQGMYVLAIKTPQKAIIYKRIIKN